MRRLAILLLLVGIAPLAFAEKHDATQMVTVEQLEQALATAHSRWDGKLAKQISYMKLTERLSDARFARLEKELHGPQSRQALLALADESQFLDLPAAEIPSNAVPSAAGQAELLAKTMDYVNKAVAKLPNFYAIRTTTLFLGTPTVISDKLHDWLFQDLEGVSYRRLIATGITSVTVLYRNGQDAYPDNKKRVESECHNPYGAVSSGQFGEMLTFFTKVAAQGKIHWSHWELGPTGLQAVFHYTAVLDFQETLNCPNEVGLPQGPVNYQGEIGVNPSDGSVLRFTRIEHTPEDVGFGPQKGEGDMLVEYGPMEIGGMNYICPVKSVFIGLYSGVVGPRKLLDSINRSYGLTEDAVQELLDDVTFGQYHLFRAEAHILPGESPIPDATPSASSPAPPAASPQR